MTLLGIAMLALLAQQQPAVVQGMVVDSITGRPLPGVTIQLRGLRGATLLVGDTVADGAFTFRSVPPGEYAIEAMRGGYISDFFGQRPDEYYPPVHRIDPGQTLSGIQIALTPGAVIYGRLVNDRGEVVVNATVEALLTTYIEGQRVLIRAQSATTNDLGEYRLFMLPPGQYRVNVVQTAFRAESAPSDNPIPLYFPGTIDPTEVQVIDLQAGEIRGGIDFSSLPTRMRRITGRIQGSGADPSLAFLSPRNGAAQIRHTANVDTGEFEFNNVMPGSYTLSARTVDLRASVPLDVRNADVLNARITLTPGYQIPAHVRIEGHPENDDPEVEKLYFLVRSEDPIPGLDPETYSPLANGDFPMDVLPGDYRLELTQREDFYVKSMKLGDVDVLNSGLHVTGSTDTRLEILIGTNPGSVEGRVEIPTVGRKITVVLVPDAARRGQRALYKAQAVGASGQFHFDNVPPGDYKLFASQEENGGPWLDPEYLRKYEERATPVRVEEGKKSGPARSIPYF